MTTGLQRFDSRQSMKTNTFEVFHYRDSRPGSVDVHHHDFYEIYYFLSGRVSFRVEGQTFDMEPGDLLLIDPMELHQAQISPDTLYERIVLWVNKAYLDNLGGHTDLTACFDSRHSNFLRPDRRHRHALRALLEQLTEEYYSQKLGSSIYAKGLLEQFLVELNRLAQRQQEPRQEEDLVSRVLDYISTHYSENISLDSLSAQFFISKYHLSHAFRARVGTSVYRYIVLRRLMQARQLLSEGVSPGDVCQLCGFTDYANFYRAFKAAYGVSPSSLSVQQTP